MRVYSMYAEICHTKSCTAQTLRYLSTVKLCSLKNTIDQWAPELLWSVYIRANRAQRYNCWHRWMGILFSSQFQHSSCHFYRSLPLGIIRTPSILMLGEFPNNFYWINALKMAKLYGPFSWRRWWQQNKPFSTSYHTCGRYFVLRFIWNVHGTFEKQLCKRK